eukprot:7892694-Alexandrium_andersonii.AAC.1
MSCSGHAQLAEEHPHEEVSSPTQDFAPIHPGPRTGLRCTGGTGRTWVAWEFATLAAWSSLVRAHARAFSTRPI